MSLDAKQTTNCQGYSDCQNETKISIGEMTTINLAAICYKIKLNHYPFQHPKQILEVTAHSNLLANKQLNEEERLMSIYLSGSNISALNAKILTQEYQMPSSFATESHYSISVSKFYQSMISMGRCNEYKTYENCLAECRVDLFRQMCNCTPISWSDWASSEIYEECKLSKYTSCANYSGDDDNICAKKHCVIQADLCERWIYNVEYLQRDFRPTGSRIVLQIGSFDYPIYKEQYESSFEEFLGKLGGAFNFYLGLNFLRLLLILCKSIAFLGFVIASCKN